jgi:hypothetical protein
MSRGALGTLAVACLVLALAATAAIGAEGPTRDEYREQVEPICKTNTKANERILKGVRKQVQYGQLKAAGAKFAKAAAALKKARGDLVGVPRPPADVERLKTWLDYVKQEADYFALAARKLKAEDKKGASQVVVKLTQTANRANAEVLPFNFTYCRLEPSRFT